MVNINKGKKMKIERLNKGDWGNIKAFFDLKTDEGLVLKGFKLIDGINGMFVGFPSQKDNEGQYHDTIYAEKEIKVKVLQVAMNEYNKIPS